MSYLRKGLVLLTSLIVLLVLALEGYYYYKINKLEPVKQTSGIHYPRELLEVFWISLSGEGELYIEPHSATGLALDILVAIQKNTSRLVMAPSSWPKGMNVSNLVSRRLLRLRESEHDPTSQGDWHINSMVVSIWVSNNYSALEALEYLLDGAFFGNSVYGVEAALEFFFEKEMDEVNISEAIILYAVLYNPLRLFPCSDNQRFLKRVEYLAERLKVVAPLRHQGFKFEMPEMSRAVKKLCAR